MTSKKVVPVVISIVLVVAVAALIGVSARRSDRHELVGVDLTVASQIDALAVAAARAKEAAEECGDRVSEGCIEADAGHRDAVDAFCVLQGRELYDMAPDEIRDLIELVEANCDAVGYSGDLDELHEAAERFHSYYVAEVVVLHTGCVGPAQRLCEGR